MLHTRTAIKLHPMAVRLTEGAISAISTGKWQATDVKPVIQLLDIRIVQTQTASTDNKERYRVRISDGLFHQQGMLATQLNDMVRSQQLQKGSVVQLNEFVKSMVRDKMIIIITSVDVILSICDIIGDAKLFPSTSGSEPSTLRSLVPMQSFNQPATMGGPQSFTGSYQRPNLGVNSPNYQSNQEHNAGLHSYAMAHAPTMLSRQPANSYMRPAQPTHNQPPPMYMNRGPTARNEASPKIVPIDALNPYQGRWTIKARVTAKAELRHYNNARGDGKVFSFDLLDADGGEIRTTCFNAVADQFYDQIEVGKVYFISKGNIKPAQKAFNHLKNDNEITLDHTSTIQPCLDDDNSIPQQQFNFRPIAEIENLDNNTILDIIGVVYSIKPSVSITRKNNTETQKRNLSLKDMSGRSVELTLWGNFCNKEGQTLQNMCDSGIFPVLAIKAARVGEFNGKNVGTISSSQLCIEPDFPKARELRTWYDNVGKNTPSIPLSHDAMDRTDARKTVSQIKDENLGTSEKPDYITVSATLSFIKVENFYYTACPLMLGERKCSKKVTNNGDGKWQCDRCDQAVDECDYRYILQLQIQDQTGSTWATAFQEPGEDIMGISAKDLYYIKQEEQDEDRFTEIVRNALYNKYNFKLKVKEESFGDEQRVKSTVLKVEKIKPSSDTSFLLDLLKKEDPKSDIPIGASAASNNFTGSVGIGIGVGQQASLPASEAGQYVNQYGSGVGQQSGLPASQIGQYGNQYGGSRHGVICNSCGGVGHSSVNCPSAVNGSGGRFNSIPSAGGNSSTCYKCHQPGHWAKDCPGVNNVSTAYVGGNVAPGRYGSASGQYVGGY